MLQLLTTLYLAVLLALAARAAEALPQRPGDRLVLDDFETAGPLRAWAASGGPEAECAVTASAAHSGRQSLCFRVQVDYTRGGNPQYPQGWLFLERTFAPPQDGSAFATLEFQLLVPPGQPASSASAIRFGLETSATAGKEPAWLSVSPEALTPGEWLRVAVPLDRRVLGAGGLGAVTRLRFYVAESWYAHGDDLRFYLDDVALSRADALDNGDGDRLRYADEPVRTPAAYLALQEPALYPVVPLEFIYPETDLAARPHVRELRACGAPGETVPVTFAVVAGAAPIRDLLVAVGVPRGPAEPAPAMVAEVRVVKVWEQAALDWEVSGPQDRIRVPELLLPDDRIDFADESLADGRYVPPHVLNRPFGTDVPAHTAKQVWINLDIPAGAGPGSWRGSVRLTSASGLAETTLPLLVEVLPFALPEPRPFYGIYDRKVLVPGQPASITREAMLADLKALRQAGFSAAYCPSVAALPELLRLLREVGMTGPLMINGEGRPEAAAQVAGILGKASYAGSWYLYGVDEPDNPERYARHTTLAAAYRAAGARVTTAITPSAAANLRRDGLPLDWANLTIQDMQSAGHFQAVKAGRQPRTAPVETYYWQVYQENPTRNRLLCGFYLWRSGADGAFPYEFQVPGNLVYTTDRRESMYEVKKGDPPRIFRGWCLLYPSQEGPVATLQWEACRLGINDVRYLTLLDGLLQRLAEGGQAGAAQTWRAEMDRIVAGAATPPLDVTVHSDPYVPPAVFTTARQALLELILRARQAGLFQH